ncbi:hypothetical protein QBC44DRAFT_326001 [Cladorrhinum sp. PSN332]|nr:hypothetical protein QBC44DRAFT_326001 [Cladorrhinum sp. PSN332]
MYAKPRGSGKAQRLRKSSFLSVSNSRSWLFLHLNFDLHHQLAFLLIFFISTALDDHKSSFPFGICSRISLGVISLAFTQVCVQMIFSVHTCMCCMCSGVKELLLFSRSAGYM